MVGRLQPIGASIPVGQGDMSPNIYEGADVHGNVPPPKKKILEVMSFSLGLFYPVTATAVYFNANYYV